MGFTFLNITLLISFGVKTYLCMFLHFGRVHWSSSQCPFRTNFPKSQLDSHTENGPPDPRNCRRVDKAMIRIH